MKRSPGRGRLKAVLIAALALALAAVGLAAGLTPSVVAGDGPPALSTRDGTPVTSVPRPAPIVYRPAGLSSATPVPLVVALYGDDGCPQCMEGLTKFEHVADEHGFVVAYPGSTTNPPWNGPDDMSYVSSLIDQVISSQNIDPLRVYVTGFSAGGRMTYQVGCSLNGKLAAIAIVSSVMREFPCALSHPLSELTIDGGDELVAVYGSTNGIPSALSTAARWRGLDRCPNDLQSQVSQVGPVRQETWEPCADGSAVGLYILAGGHHTWPGSYGLSPSDPDSQYNASEGIWAFFAAHPAVSLTQFVDTTATVGGQGAGTVNNNSGLPGSATPTAGALRVTSLSLTNRTFVVGNAVAPASATAAAVRHKKGTTFRYTLSRAATVKIVLAGWVGGLRAGRRCVAPTPRLRKARRCRRAVTPVTLTRTSHQGANAVAFSGRIASRALKPGAYKASLTATAAGTSSPVKTITFTIVKR